MRENGVDRNEKNLDPSATHLASGIISRQAFSDEDTDFFTSQQFRDAIPHGHSNNSQKDGFFPHVQQNVHVKQSDTGLDDDDDGIGVETLNFTSTKSWVYWIKSKHGGDDTRSVSSISESDTSSVVSNVKLEDYDKSKLERVRVHKIQQPDIPRVKSLMMGGIDDFLFQVSARATKLFVGDMPSLDESSNTSSNRSIGIMYSDTNQLSM